MHLPLTTPFLPDGQLNTKKLRDNVRRYSKTPAAGLVALANSGQPSLLSDEETHEVFRVVADAAVAEKVLIAGVKRDSVRSTLDLIAFAAQAGFDAALVPLPGLLRGNDRAASAFSFFRAVADASALPIILDSAPGQDTSLALDLVIEVARHSNVIGSVDASGDVSRIAEVLKATAIVRREATVTSVFAAVTGRMLAKSVPLIAGLVSSEMLSAGGTAVTLWPAAAKPSLKTRVKMVGFQVLCSRTADMLNGLLAGATGAMPALAAAAPQACYEVLAAWKDGDPALADEKQERLRAVAERVEEQLGVAGIKYGSDLNGYFGGRPRLPTLPLTAAKRAEIEVLMAGIRN